MKEVCEDSGGLTRREDDGGSGISWSFSPIDPTAGSRAMSGLIDARLGVPNPAAIGVLAFWSKCVWRAPASFSSSVCGGRPCRSAHHAQPCAAPLQKKLATQSAINTESKCLIKGTANITAVYFNHIPANAFCFDHRFDFGQLAIKLNNRNRISGFFSKRFNIITIFSR